jgi:hypothetical protein
MFDFMASWLVLCLTANSLCMSANDPVIIIVD